MSKARAPKDRMPTTGFPGARLRLRVVFANDIRLGPGKADLLEAIDRAGSISAAGRALGMSYRRAWMLVDEINRLFRQPAVSSNVGGAHGGGAQLTDFGRDLVAAWRRIEARTEAVVGEELAPFADALSVEARRPAPEPER